MQVTPDQFDKPSGAGPQGSASGGSPWHQLWEGLKRDVLQAPQVAAAKAPQIGRDLAEGATGLASDVGRSLLPGRQGAAAGGRVLGKVGDVAALASGGFAGPTMPPAGARAPVGGTLRATPAMRGAATGAAPLSSYPEIRPNPGGGFDIHTSSGGTLYAKTEAGARAEADSARGWPDRGRAANSNTPALAKADPTPEASPLATAMVKGDQTAIDRHLTSSFRRAVKPGRQPFATAGRLDAQDRKTMNAIDSIIANKDDLKLTDANDREMRPGSTPKTLHQFSEAIEQQKGKIFNQYDEMATKSGGQGVRVPLQPAIDTLITTANDPEVLALHPELPKIAMQFAQNWSKIGSFSPKQMQSLIQNMNKTYQGSNPSREIISERALMQPVMQTMRATLDQAIESSQGPGYQPLKNQYRDLLSIERDVANAVQREAKNIPGGLVSTFTNPAAAFELMHGVFLADPAALRNAALIKGSQMAIRWAKSPNRAVAQMFAHRARQGQIVPLASAVPGAMGMTQTGFVGGQGDTGPNGGRIIARTSLPTYAEMPSYMLGGEKGTFDLDTLEERYGAGRQSNKNAKPRAHEQNLEDIRKILFPKPRPVV